MSKSFVIGLAATGENILVDLDQLIRTRALITASPGGGKSGLISALCEQVIDQVQIILLDPEGEFSHLRSKYPFVLAGPDGDTPAVVKTSALLAEKLLSLGTSAIIDIYELPPHQRHEYVRDFLNALIDAPKTLWPSMNGRALVVIVDEAHIFSPEKGQGAESVASQAMANLASRGRKRGYCSIFATQRLSMLSKTTAAMCNNVFVGRSAQIDQKRSAEQLHISGKSAQEELFKRIARMPTRTFYAYGMAFQFTEPTLFTVRTATTIPKDGVKTMTAPPAPKGMKAVLASLATLPQEAEKKAKTIEDLEKEIAELKRQLKSANDSPTISLEREAMLIHKMQDALDTASAYERALDSITATAQNIGKQMTDLQAMIAEVKKPGTQFLASPLKTLPGSTPITVSKAHEMAKRTVAKIQQATDTGDASLSKGEREIMIPLSWYEDGLQREGLTVFSGYKKTSRDAYIQRATAKGFVFSQDGKVFITDKGRSALGSVDAPPLSSEDLTAWWMAKLGNGGESKLLSIIVNAGESGISRNAITDATEYKKTSRDAYIQRLTARQLVHSSNGLVYANSRLIG